MCGVLLVEALRGREENSGPGRTPTAESASMAAVETGASSSPELDDEDLSPGEAQARLQALQQVCQDLTRKINELDMDRTEHGLVIDALKPLDPNRKCFRMVGDVVVERTISEVFPAVVKNRDAIIDTMNKMGEALASKQKYADAFAAKHKVSAQSTQAAPAAEESSEGGSQGVLI